MSLAITVFNLCQDQIALENSKPMHCSRYGLKKFCNGDKELIIPIEVLLRSTLSMTQLVLLSVT